MDNLIGKQFGRLTIQAIGKIVNGHRMVECLCACGIVTHPRLSALVRKGRTTKSCGCSRKGHFSDLSGLKTGKLLVKELAYIGKDRATYWKCACDCGNECIIKGSRLDPNGTDSKRYTKSCGCLITEVNERLTKNRTISTKGAEGGLYCAYKAAANAHNREFRLTKEECLVLFKTGCFYCGTKPKQVRKGRGQQLSFIYNGIDRVDNQKGYTIENCVSCCKFCNLAKGKNSQKDFLQWIETTYKFCIKSKLIG
jgi:hypothetical protein